jgi:hypothetical protein
VPSTPWAKEKKRTHDKMHATNSENGTGPVTAYIALGSNLGDRVAMIEDACNRLTARGIKVKRTSSLWETKPMYVLDQDSFINGACEVNHHKGGFGHVLNRG